jgi:hypothetical protein
LRSRVCFGSRSGRSCSTSTPRPELVRVVTRVCAGRTGMPHRANTRDGAEAPRWPLVDARLLGQDSRMGTIVWQSVVVRVACADCGRESDPLWRGYRACRLDEPNTGEEPAFAFFCRDCAQLEYGR